MKRLLTILTALAAALALVLGPLSSPATAADSPFVTGPSVQAGSVSFSVSADGLTYTWKQTSARAIVEVPTLTLPAGQTWRIDQPSPTSALMVRVAGGSGESTIAGKVRANGQLAVVDAAGVLLPWSADVRAQSIVLGSIPVDDQSSAFLKRQPVHFAFGGDSRVQQEGNVSARGGTVALISSGSIENEGRIEAPSGRVVLMAAVSAHVHFGLPRPTVTEGYVGPGRFPVPNKRVLNQGLIDALGGEVLLDATSSDSIRSMGRIRAVRSILTAPYYFVEDKLLGGLDVVCELRRGKLRAEVRLDRQIRTSADTVQTSHGTLSFDHRFVRKLDGTKYLYVNALDDAGATTTMPSSYGSTSCSAEQLTPGHPRIVGKHKTGHVLTALTGRWAPAGVKLSYQWLRDGRPINGAMHARYRVRSKDAGHLLSVRVTGSKATFENLTTTSRTVRVQRTGHR